MKLGLWTVFTGNNKTPILIGYLGQLQMKLSAQNQGISNVNSFVMCKTQ